MFQIVTFYRFKNFDAEELLVIKEALRAAMSRFEIKGTVVLATEGFNATVCGEPQNVEDFLRAGETVLSTEFEYKSSYHASRPFRRAEAKIKPEIVTLKKDIDISKGAGTHVKPGEWDRLISKPDVLLIDVRNHYEVRNGTFERALDPKISKFSELPQFVADNLDPAVHKKVAMFCTGGIRCEKLAPYLKELGFEDVYQLEGGILRYLADKGGTENLWSGECFVFDNRLTVDAKLEKGVGTDYSLSDPAGAG